jgi:hypothetical protein
MIVNHDSIQWLFSSMSAYSVAFDLGTSILESQEPLPEYLTAGVLAPAIFQLEALGGANST